MSTFDSLNDTFDITPSEPEAKPVKELEDTQIMPAKAEETAISSRKEQEQDFRYARGHLYSIVEKMAESVDGAMEVAQQSDHPRAWEVAMNGAKAAAEVVEKLAALHATHARLDRESDAPKAANTGTGTQNNIFMTGSTSELMAALKEMKDQDK